MIDGLILWLAKMQIPYRQNEESHDLPWAHISTQKTSLLSTCQQVLESWAYVLQLSFLGDWHSVGFRNNLLTSVSWRDTTGRRFTLRGSKEEISQKERGQRQAPAAPSWQPGSEPPRSTSLSHPWVRSHGKRGCGLQHFLSSPASPEKLSVNLSATHTYSPMTGSLQTEICTLQSLMKFVLTPKSKVMRRKLVHSLTWRFQTAVLKLQKDIFLLSPDFN